MNPKLIARLLSRLFAVLAVAMAAAIPWGWSVPESGGASEALTASAAIALFTAVVLAFIGKGADKTVRLRDALVVVTVAWIASGILGALPYTLSGAIPAFHDAIFESVSGFTTTGATILTADKIEALPRSLHFWRVTTHWLGGLGIVVLFVALFPQFGVGAKHLFKSEVPGPITEGLRPKIKQTAVALWWIYVGLTGLESLLLWWAGLDPFEAIAHSMSTLATGGFSTQAGSIGEFNLPQVEWIICVFMYLAGVNFGLHYAVLGGRWRQFLRDGEWRFYSTVFLVTVVVIAVVIVDTGTNKDPETAFRHSMFQTLAIMTGTGFSTDNFAKWPILGQTILILLMFVGGSAGSTAGGMKMKRVIILAKTAVIELVHTVRPHAVRVVKISRTAIGSDVLKQVYAFSVLFVGAVIFLTLWLTLTVDSPNPEDPFDLVSAFSAALSCVANVGPGLGKVGPEENYALISVSGKLFLSLGMILGRLEFFTVLALLLPSTWRR